MASDLDRPDVGRERSLVLDETSHVSKEREMEEHHSPLSPANTYPSARCSEHQLDETLKVEDLDTLDCSTLSPLSLSPKPPFEALDDDEEEAQWPLRDQDLREGTVQLTPGSQEWQDGCTYHGEFGLDMKMGYGEFSWPTGETYHGQFYRDHRHGLGTYRWPDGSSFSGMFYLSDREGYGTLCLKGRNFQGLYRRDKRFGPGVMTYADGSQDVGLWLGDHLLQLCTEHPGAFSLDHYPEFAAFLSRPMPRVHLPEEDLLEWDLDEARDPFFYDYKRFLQDDDLTLPPELFIYSTDHSHLPMTSSFRRELDRQLFLLDPPVGEEPWLVKNETPLLVRMRAHAHRFRNRKVHTRWNMGAILAGDRSAFGSEGPRERSSKDTILKAEEGDTDWVFAALRDNLVSPDVADSRGYTVLHSAAVHSRLGMVNLLLDRGADVNKRSDEGLTALSMCFLLYYPASGFRPNVAERNLPPHQESTKPMTVHRYSSLALDLVGQLLASEEPEPEPDLLMQTPFPTPTVNVPAIQCSPESSQERSSCPASLSTSFPSSACDRETGTLDQISVESHFESTMSLHNFSIELTQDLLQCSAQAYSTLRVPSQSCDEGTMRKMARSMVEHRNCWLTIQLLLRRGADPNLCRVPMEALFFAVKAGDVDGVRLLLERGAHTHIQFPAQLRSLTPLHIAAALPGQEGIQITELLLHAVTDVDARAADQEESCKPGKLDLLPSSLKLSNELGPPSNYYSLPEGCPDEGGRTALHVACEREDNQTHARDVVHLLLSHKANPNMLWSGHSPLSLAITSGNDLIVKELLAHGADPNLLLTKGFGSALCVACDINYETQRSMDSKLALIDQLINSGADILNPVILRQGDKVAVGTAVDYGYYRFFQDRKIAHSAFHTLMPTERDLFLTRKRLLEYMGFLLRSAVQARESQWDPKALYLSKRVLGPREGVEAAVCPRLCCPIIHLVSLGTAELVRSHRVKRKSMGSSRAQFCEDQKQSSRIPFFKFCSQCGRSVGVRLVPCPRCYGILTCSKYCKSRSWMEFHKKDCGEFIAIAAVPVHSHHHREEEDTDLEEEEEEEEKAYRQETSE